MNKCKCGCGQECKREYINGHSNKNKKFSKEHCKKLSQSGKGKHSGFQNGMYGKLGILNPLFKRKQSDKHIKKKSLAIKGKNNGMYGKVKELSPTYGKPGAMLGRKHSEETKRKIGDKKKGVNSHFFGKTPSIKSGRCQWFEVNGIKCQGTFEKRFVEACIKYKIPVKRNTKRFFLKDSLGEFSYLPDFVLNDSLVVEIKGWKENPKWLRKISFFERHWCNCHV